MYIGKLVQERINQLGLTASYLVDECFLDFSFVMKVLNDKITLEEIDEFSLALLCGALHCQPEFFTDKSVREKDLVYASKNNRNETPESIKVKANIQTYIGDAMFVEDIQ